jgi:hypothetical protein
MELKNKTKQKLEEIHKLQHRIDNTHKGLTIEYDQRQPGDIIRVSSGELSAYELTAEEKTLPEAQKDDIKHRKKEQKRLMKLLQKSIRRRVDENIKQNVTPFGQWPSMCKNLHTNKNRFNSNLN